MLKLVEFLNSVNKLNCGKEFHTYLYEKMTPLHALNLETHVYIAMLKENAADSVVSSQEYRNPRCNR